MTVFFNIVIKLLIFLTVNAIGAFIIPILLNLALLTGWSAADMDEEMTGKLIDFFLVGGTWSWIVGSLISPGFLIFEGRKRFIFLSLPIVVPLLYGVSVLMILT